MRVAAIENVAGCDILFKNQTNNRNIDHDQKIACRCCAVRVDRCRCLRSKPVVCAVTDIQDDPTNGLEMCRSLFIEYFLSELTTHAKVNVLDTRTVQNAIGALKFEHGKNLPQKRSASFAINSNAVRCAWSP